MIIRAIKILFVVASGASLSQFPEFSQQYLQRLAGAVDELRVITANFDNTAQANGLSREEALNELSGTDFRDAHQNDMRENFARLEHLETALENLKNSSVMERVLLSPSVFDTKVVMRTYDDFKPAAPLTVEGAASAGLGGVIGWVVILSLLALPRLFRRKKPQTA